MALELEKVKNKYEALKNDSGKQSEAPDEILAELREVQNQKKILQQKLKQAIGEVKIRSEKGLSLLQKVKKLDAELSKSEEEKVVMAVEVVALREEKAKLEKQIMDLQ